jgi:hypothetical protein
MNLREEREQLQRAAKDLHLPAVQENTGDYC